MLEQPPRAKLFNMPRVKDKPKPPKPKTPKIPYAGSSYYGYGNQWYETQTFKWGGPKLQVGKSKQNSGSAETYATLKFPEKDKNLAKELISSASIAMNMTENHFICSRQHLINVARNLLKSTTTAITTQQNMSLATGLLKDVTLVLQALGIPKENCHDEGETVIFKSRSKAFSKSLTSWDYFSSITAHAVKVSNGEEE